MVQSVDIAPLSVGDGKATVVSNTKKLHETIRLYMRIKALRLLSSTIKNVEAMVKANCTQILLTHKPTATQIIAIRVADIGNA